MREEIVRQILNRLKVYCLHRVKSPSSRAVSDENSRRATSRDQLKKPLLPVYVISGGDPLLAQECRRLLFASSVPARKDFPERELFPFCRQSAYLRLESRSLNESNSHCRCSRTKRFSKFALPNGKPGDKGAARRSAELCAKPNPRQSGSGDSVRNLKRAAQNSKWMKTLESAAGAHIQVWPVDANQMPRWIRSAS